MKLHIGFDDTDSPQGGCTTYVAAILVKKIRNLGLNFFDYPNLIRLNPNVPWKTRGNGALCLRTLCEEDHLEDIKESVLETIEDNSVLSWDGTDPGVVFLLGDIPSEIEEFAQRTIQSLVKMNDALRLAKRFRAEAVGFKKRRGIIGALAAVGEQLKGDHTFELITYRKPENYGTPRKIAQSSVIKMNKEMNGLTFNNIDPETGRILITPHGPDPILYGIRGETPEAVRRAHEMILSEEPIERWVIFRTNHGTDAHLKRVLYIKDVKPYNPVIIRGKVTSMPRIIEGGHVIFQIRDETGQIDCAAYKPTSILRNTAKALMVGDLIEGYGGIRPPSIGNSITLNLEKIRILQLVPNLVFQNPLCPLCGKRTKSMGKMAGFECKRCGFHGPKLEKAVYEQERLIAEGLYVTSPRSERHLTKPLTRYGLEKAAATESVDKVIPYLLFSSPV